METSLGDRAITVAIHGMRTFCKFLSANDTGETGGHQAGIYIAKPAIPILFEKPFQRGENGERWVKVTWNDELTTDTRFIYYGQKTRNEYRITNFGKGFPFLKPQYTGALFVFTQMTEDDYIGYFLNTEDDIQNFLDSFGISPIETNCLLKTEQAIPGQLNNQTIQKFLDDVHHTFPSGSEMAMQARLLRYKLGISQTLAVTDPDSIILDWIDCEYQLFRALENDNYGSQIRQGFSSMDDFLELAKAVLNRRKSRAGKSLESHLAAIFDANHLKYTAQANTEENKRPDFIFPSESAYHDMTFDTDLLTSLAAKTTCKDRWRQILNEADRLRDREKYLCTLQQGISGAQMDEMQAERVILVVPKKYIGMYPKDRQDRIWTIGKFVRYICEKEGIT